jgi:hypothetical protein
MAHTTKSTYRARRKGRGRGATPGLDRVLDLLCRGTPADLEPATLEAFFGRRLRRLLGQPPEWLLLQGNEKLGENIYVWNIPAGPLTCPGLTGLCGGPDGECYALRGHHNWPSTRGRHISCYLLSTRPDWVDRMTSELAWRDIRRVRLHGSGDVYSAAYAEKLIAVADRAPTVKFFLYTRSWRVAGILPSLVELSRRPNVALWFSADRDAPSPPYVPGVRVAFLATSRDDEKLVSRRRHDLVFRTDRHRKLSLELGPLTEIQTPDGPVPVCPHEHMTKEMFPAFDRAQPTCTSCRWCTDRDRFVSRRKGPDPLAIIDV